MTEYDDMDSVAKILAILYSTTGSEIPVVFTFDRNNVAELSPSEIIIVTVKRVHKHVSVNPFDRLIIEEPMPV